MLVPAKPEAQAGAVDAAAAVSVGDIEAEEEEASRSLEEEEGDAEGGGRLVPSLLSPLQKRVALAIAAVLVGLVFLLDRHGGRTTSPQLIGNPPTSPPNTTFPSSLTHLPSTLIVQHHER
jgi:hypothetical protein